MPQPVRPELFFGLFVGRSPLMQRVYRLIIRAASASYPVLITGETGTGKELVARAIHVQSRPQRPFVALDCSAVSPALFEAEMFGSLKGAYTGAIADRKGLMEMADSGTLFFDEIGNLPLELQPKILRALQQKEIRPVGCNYTRGFAARIIAATNVPLEQAVAEKRFRADLFYRLNVMQITLPPLRARREDIEPLVRHIMAQCSEELGPPREISPSALARLQQYDWPGNVRQLQNVVERAMAFEADPMLEFPDLPSEPCGLPASGPIQTLASMEYHALLRAVQLADDNKLLAAKMLGIGKTTLYRKLREYKQEARRHTPSEITTETVEESCVTAGSVEEIAERSQLEDPQQLGSNVPA
ncbi:MAG TPA: sigma-54 dependent transcriptional regulator [Terriglobales bacterium]|nr:sigma-54 dependent transcriptional regulator [Terriglobales bacterium]